MKVQLLNFKNTKEICWNSDLQMAKTVAESMQKQIKK